MSLFKKVLEDIEKGRRGLNEGLPLGLARTDAMLCGLQAGTYYLVGGDTGCLAKGTKVLMYDGSFKNVEDVKVDDLLMGPDATPRKVLRLFRGQEQMYWIHQNKGISYRVNENHVLSLKASGTRATKKFGQVVNMTVKDYLNLNSYDSVHLKGYKTKELGFLKSIDIEIDPYFLGLWLGDGHSDQPSITTIDPEIKTFIFDFASKTGLSVSPRSKTGSKAVTYALVNYEEYLNSLKEKFKAYNLLYNKHIPKEYLYNSEEVRLQLLAGLLDTDGHYNRKKNEFEITQKRKILAEEITFLARSLGFYVGFESKKATIKSSGFECEVYRVRIYGALHKIPTKIARKQAKVSTRITDPLITGITVVKDIVDNFYGFELDQDNLFLLEDLTVTHNSGKSHLVNNLFLLNPLDHLRVSSGGKKLKIVYFSFEMVAKVHIVRAIPRYLWLHHGLITSPNMILSRGQKNRLPDEIYDRVKEANEYFEWIEDHIIFIDSTLGKTEIDKVLRKVACENGTFTKDEFGNETYKPHDPDLIVLGILDHYGLSKKEDEAATKQIIDGISKVFVNYRNICNFSFVALNQFNRDIQSSDRKKLGAIEPQLADFKDTAGSQEDADMVLAIAYPWRYQYTTYKDFDISTLKDYFRCLHVLKNRNGEANKHIGLNFHGNLGLFLELPRVKDMTQHDYSRAIDLDLCKQDKADKKEDKEN